MQGYKVKNEVQGRTKTAETQREEQSDYMS